MLKSRLSTTLGLTSGASAHLHRAKTFQVIYVSDDEEEPHEPALQPGALEFP